MRLQDLAPRRGPGDDGWCLRGNRISHKRAAVTGVVAVLIGVATVTGGRAMWQAPTPRDAAHFNAAAPAPALQLAVATRAPGKPVEVAADAAALIFVGRTQPVTIQPLRQAPAAPVAPQTEQTVSIAQSVLPTAAGAVAVFAPQPDTPRPQPRPAAIATATDAAPGPADAVDPVQESPVLIVTASSKGSPGAGPEVSPWPQPRPAGIAGQVQLAARTPAEASAQPAPAQPAAVAAAGTSAPGIADCPSRLTRAIPRRKGDARDGSALSAELGGLRGTARDGLIAREALAGNVPAFLRRLTPVALTGTSAAGASVQITVCVTPDYLALGSDGDYLRVPMGLPEAALIADQLGFLLPTTRIVDATYAQAGLRLPPRPMQAGPQMTSTSYFSQHNATIEGQSDAAGFRSGQLLAGTKKDLVLSNALRRAPGQVAIYGWHQPNGKPIQPLSTVHEARYSDYSHGLRLVSKTAYLNGREVALGDLLQDPGYAGIISSEGPIPEPQRLLASLYTH